jgi:dolichol-phosphate mannosyltransferase
MRHLLKKYDFMKMITHPRRMGQTAALSTGFQAATGEIVIIMDGDLQIFPEDIYILINKMAEGYDLVNGMRTERKGVFLLKICSIIFSSAVSIIFNIYIKDMASNFKAFRREFIKNLDLTSNDHRYIIPIVYNRGARKIAEVSVRHAKRVQGKSKYRLSKILAAIPEFFWFYHRYRKGYYDLN